MPYPCETSQPSDVRGETIGTSHRTLLDNAGRWAWCVSRRRTFLFQATAERLNVPREFFLQYSANPLQLWLCRAITSQVIGS